MRLVHGDCLEVMRSIADNSVDAIVTDPPYGLSFMGKKWDYDVPSEDIWRECLRVLKPGGHLLAFAGTRTQHRMAVRIEDAGFEIRDMIAWIYGSGFPKSLDVSKAIDRTDASEEQERRRLRFTAWVRSTGATARQIDAATGTNMGGHYTTAACQPAIMTREHLEACRHLLGGIPDWVEREADIRSVESRNMAEREVLGVQKGAMSGWDVDGGTKYGTRNITAPATDDAKKWNGWGTALKPALEPITVARKPLSEKTIAANVLKWGTGAINIDGGRTSNEGYTNGGKNKGIAFGVGDGATLNARCTGEKGRFPANLIHDGNDEVLELFPAEKDKSAARFFYCAKASKRDRGSENNHPTVKPTDLMRYLCRLVTPPGGIILDPFMGSGSTGKAARLEGFDFIGIEREIDSFKIAEKRVKS